MPKLLGRQSELAAGSVPAVTLDRANTPWAFSRGEPFRTIAAIELFASLISFMVFVDEESGNEKATPNLSGMTDNSGNTPALAKLMSPKFPLIVIMTEMAAQLQASSGFRVTRTRRQMASQMRISPSSIPAAGSWWRLRG